LSSVFHEVPETPAEQMSQTPTGADRFRTIDDLGNRWYVDLTGLHRAIADDVGPDPEGERALVRRSRHLERAVTPLGRGHR